MRRLVLLAIVPLLAGCITHREIAGRAVSYNLAVEKAHNEMLLLNVVRSKERRPMYFTAIGEVNGSLRWQASTGGIGVSVGPGDGDDLSLSPSAAYTTNPTFDVGVLGSQEFVRGILSPVKLETLEFYWRQGWPPELLLHLAVERIEKRTGKDLDGSWENDPDDWPKFVDFQAKLRELLASLKFERTRTPVDVGPPLYRSDLADLSDLVEVANSSGLKLEPTSAYGYQLRRYVTGYEFKVDGETVRTSEQKLDLPEAGASYYLVTLRSPHAILYYLGEVMRAIKRGNVPTVYTRAGQAESAAPLFVARERSAECPAAIVQVRYGSDYLIPLEGQTADRCQPGRSMQVLSLVSQLIGLQTKKDELPTTQTVRLVGN